jgi:teichuronic acid biosynthesis glycosyltransferase TuaC
VRILTFTSLFPNARQPLHGIFIYQRIAHLALRQGCVVRVVAPVPYFPSWLPGERWSSFKGIPGYERIGRLIVYHPRYPLLPKISMPFQGLLMFLGAFRLVQRLQRKMKFDCLDAHYVYPDGFAATLLARLLKLPVIISARGTDINLFPQFWMIRPMIRWTLKRSDGLIGVCSALKDAMVELGAAPAKARVIGNGVDLQRFGPIERRAARRKLGISEEGEIVVSVGSLIPRKGYHYLIPAFAKIAPRHPNLQLYIVGEGNFRGELERIVENLDMNGRIKLVGNWPNEELALWYCAADVSCLVSSREGWPNVLLESMACGTPVVATRVWGVPEIITSPELGIMVEQDSEDIAKGLDRALLTEWDRTRLVKHAGTRTWEVVAEEVENFLLSRVSLAAQTR